MTTITAPAGFFLNDAVSPTTATDLITAVTAAQANITGALDAETNAAASATAAAASAAAANGSQTAAATNATNAASSAANASSSETAAGTSATNAASSASAASTSATAAASSASAASTSQSAAASSATLASNSATNAATSATNAAASATAAANAVGTIPTPASGIAKNFIRVNSSGNAYEAQTPAQVATDVGVLNDVGRNFLHNPKFEVAQRGTGPFTTLNTYTLDRWLVIGTLDTVSVSPVALTDADRTAIGNEEGTFCLQNVFTGNAGASAFNAITQRIENVRRLANKTVTVSFWAKANSGTPKVGVSCDQIFGTGGSPSASVSGTGTAVTLSTSWQRLSVSLTIPSTSGKTLGTNGDHYTEVNLWCSSGTTNATFAGTIGVQSGTIKFWGAQLEVGSVMTQFERIDPQTDLANCQRFFETGQFRLDGFQSASAVASAPRPFAVAKRALPTMVVNGTTTTNCSGAGALNVTTTDFSAAVTVTASASFIFVGNFTATADL